MIHSTFHEMAEEALKRLEDQLNCSICLDTYTDPKLLQCFHVFCHRCLVPLGVRDQQGQFTCPICRHITPIPATGVAGLQSAFHINHFLEIVEDSKQSPGASEGAVGRTKLPRYCMEHVREEVKLYCETCGELICYKCALKSGRHQSHDYEELNQALESYIEMIISSIEPIESQMTAVKKALVLIDQRRGEIFNQQATVEKNLHATFTQLREVLTIRETELIKTLHKETQDKLKGLAAQSYQNKIILTKLDSCLHFMKESIKVDNESDILMTKTNTVHQVKELTTPFQPDTLKPNTEADMVFSALADLTAMCQSYGQVFTLGSPDPSKCHITGKSLEVAVVGEKSTAILHSISYKGEPCEEPMLLEYKLISEITCTKASCSVERRGQSQYEINYQPAIKGRHQLHIKVEGQHVRGSPLSVAVRCPVKRFGTPILILGGVRGPRGVAITQKGELVVTEWYGCCVSVFSPSGGKIRSFGTQGSGQGQFNGPCGIAVDAAGCLLVADNHRIQKFTCEGRFLTAVHMHSIGRRFGDPIGIAFNNTNDKVYVLNDGNDRVAVLNSDLISVSDTFKKLTNGKGQFRYPHGIACDSTGNVYVADTCNDRIQVFTAEGKFLRMFGRSGGGRGELNKPYCVAVDSGDVVYVSEQGNCRVSVFTSEGRFVASFGKGEGLGGLKFPYGLAVDESGIVYVCDHSNNCVLVF